MSDCINNGINDNSNNVNASFVFQAFNYAAKMGAHIVSYSVAPSFAGMSDTISNKVKPSTAWATTFAQQTKAYTQAIQPLAIKGGLVVTAAGGDEGIHHQRAGAGMTAVVEGNGGAGQLHTNIVQ